FADTGRPSSGTRRLTAPVGKCQAAPPKPQRDSRQPAAVSTPQRTGCQAALGACVPARDGKRARRVSLNGEFPGRKRARVKGAEPSEARESRLEDPGREEARPRFPPAAEFAGWRSC